MPKIFSEFSKTFPEFKKYFDHNSAFSCIHEMAAKKKGKIVFKFFEKVLSSDWKIDERLKNLVDAAIHSLNSKCPKKKHSEFDSLKEKYEATKRAEELRIKAGQELHEAAEEMRRQHEKERLAEAMRKVHEELRQEQERQRQEEAAAKARREEEARRRDSYSSHQNSGYENFDDFLNRFFFRNFGSSSRSRTYAPPRREEPKIVVQMPEELMRLETYKNNQNFQGVFKLYEKLNTKQLDIDSQRAQKYMQEAFNVTTLKEAISCWRQLYLIIHPDKIGHLNEESKTFLNELFKFGNHYYSLASAR